VGQRVGRAQGNDAERNVAPDHALQDIVHRTIAAAGENNVAAPGDGLARLPACVGLASSGLSGRLHSRFAQDGCRCLHVHQSPGLTPAGERIVEEDGLAHLNR